MPFSEISRDFGDSALLDRESLMRRVEDEELRVSTRMLVESDLLKAIFRVQPG